ncbi:hypothetical protein A2303_01850 [Candidatus Falkowbacteria bacterium RIFOXYB2_FULL_47_14]|uniref:Uncharacterized protein n=1 Tax=Candidatus Falkowbacteria bacterium RIFOXYA2_FULL_47_19 TaxID=1797994 RepID=A0A1F5SJH0_9BACT|nr:MAG: hypothetical protein A2227_06085 [Candidatus Falkowbacteria bacterium RIFOXYA2_FULL_47_19]OGF37086.1 MAG: hypothetical protein A2468_05275 [Candidatus Falkowbacteria bacterium RIFOXYC2_FULL_46_15]OGF43255.1 MAG: hypothetical protein A2303_01850 [Candidatus Falkowbacteria bacterium RIFOXYB2_FULL_47_14]
MNIEKNIASDHAIVPWYFGRKFWGILIGLSALPGAWMIVVGYPYGLLGILAYFAGLHSLVGYFLKNFFYHATSDLFGLIYYIIFGFFMFLCFRRKKVNIIYPIIIIIIIIINTYGLIGAIIGSAP